MDTRARRRRALIVALAVALYLACAVAATWPALRDADDDYLARPAAGYGEAAAGDHLQLGWAFWLVGHQVAELRSPLEDPYTFRPVAEAPPNLQGWLFAAPYWPLDRLAGPVWAYNAIVLLAFLLAGGFAAWWLRALGLTHGAALAGGVVFCLAPYRVAQSAGHLLGLISFLLPACLLALERRRLWLAGIAIAAIPLSGQIHLALGAVPLALAYGLLRLPRSVRPAVAAAVLPAAAFALGVQQLVVEGSIAGGRSFAQVERYSAEVTDFVRRGASGDIEELVFLGWLTPVAAVAGAWLAPRGRRPVVLVLAAAAVVPCILALGAHLPLYEALWNALPSLRFGRVPERLMPIACLALAGLAALAVEHAIREYGLRARVPTPAGAAAVAAGAIAVFALDLRAGNEVFGAVSPDARSPAYAALEGDGVLLELPVFRPDLHFGSVYMAYARQSPRRRPQGYSTLAEPAADRWARRHRGLSCGRGEIPPSVAWVVVHRGLYRQSGFFQSGCARRAEAALRERGWRLVARAGEIAAYGR